MELGWSRTQVSDFIDEWIFSERDRKMLKMRHLDGAFYDTIAGEMNLSEGRVKEIICECNRVLKSHILTAK